MILRCNPNSCFRVIYKRFTKSERTLFASQYVDDVIDFYENFFYNVRKMKFIPKFIQNIILNNTMIVSPNEDWSLIEK